MNSKVKLILLHSLLVSASLFAVTGCGDSDKKLPILGERDWVKKTVDGKEVVDTIYNTIPKFAFVNQYSDTVTEKIVENKIYVTDFFFTTCPTICPVMKKQMVKVYQAYKGNPDVMILSHSIDPEHDTPAVLNKFAKDLGIEGQQWQFLTGDKTRIYEIGQNNYMSTAKEDTTVQGGYIHSGAFILVDKEKHVRGMYDGTTEEGTKKLLNDMERLLAEYKK
jgi:protein SCO1/2